MGTNRGAIRKGEHRSPATEFKPGTHWRKPKAHWDKTWLYHQYVTLGRSASEIAAEQGCIENNILYWLDKHGIPRRTIKEARAVKRWAVPRERNGMTGRRGPNAPRWKGGKTPYRQSLYGCFEWSDAVAAVWERDKATCQRCGTVNTNRRRMHIHHILPVRLEAYVYDLANMMLICSSCHGWIHSRANVHGEFLKRGGDANSAEDDTTLL